MFKNVVDFFIIKKNRKRGIHKSKRSLRSKITEWFYPSIGIRAWCKYMALYLKRQPLTSHKLSLGFAIGIFVSFTPYVGFQGLIAIILCYTFSASLLATFIGSMVGNPWTFPFIWLWIRNFGNFILHRDPTVGSMHHVEFTISAIINNLEFYWCEFIFPMSVGGIPTGIFVATVAYFVIKYQIDHFRNFRKNLLAKRKQEIKNKRKQDILQSLGKFKKISKLKNINLKTRKNIKNIRSKFKWL